MDKAFDIEMYASELVERLISIKDRYRSEMCSSDIDTLNDCANLIYHNRKEMKEL